MEQLAIIIAIVTAVATVAAFAAALWLHRNNKRRLEQWPQLRSTVQQVRLIANDNGE